MKHISAGLIIVILLLAGCARQDLPQGNLESLASWSDLGGKVEPTGGRVESLAFNVTGDPIVATTISGPGLVMNRTVYVRQWLNGQWQLLGNRLDLRLYEDADYPDIAVDNLGRPVVAWNERSDIYVKRWDGQTWVQLGDKLDVDPARGVAGLFPQIAIDSQNRPIVVWQEIKQDGSGNYNLFVKRWENDSSWVQAGDALDIDMTHTVFKPAIAIDSSDRIVVAWSEVIPNNVYNIYVKRWNGNNWVRLGGALDVDVANSATYPSLALSSTGKLYVAWYETAFNASGNPTSQDVYVKRWDGNNTWTLLGGTVGARGEVPSLAASGPDTLMVSWTSRSLPPKVYVKRWNGVDKWLSVGSQPVVIEGASYDLSISPGGVPTLAYYLNLVNPNNQDARGSYIKRFQ